MSASTSRPPSSRPSATKSRPLFHRPDGIPYDFWIQPTLDSSVKKVLANKITDNGGRIWDSRRDEMPTHGFLLINPYDASVLHQVKASFHKPVAAAATTFAFRSSVPATPYRHVLSYQFVHAVVDQGVWGRYDLMQWGWPVFFNAEDMDDMEEALSRYHKEVRKNIDNELERGWMWATGSAFYSVDPNYDYKKELDELEDALQEEAKKQGFDISNKGDKRNKWIRGRVVAHYRLTQQTKFYLHDDIPESAKKEILREILADGGACCYDPMTADVILIGSSPDQFYDDLDIDGWLKDPPVGDDKQPKKIKFVSWVYSCTDAGSVSKVNPEIHDVFIAHHDYQAQVQAKSKQQTKKQVEKRVSKPIRPQKSALAPSPSPAPGSSSVVRSKGKQRAEETPQLTLRAHTEHSTRPDSSAHLVSTIQKRRIDTIEPSTPFNLERSPFKKRKIQPTGNETNQSMDASPIPATRTYTSYKTRINPAGTTNGSSMSIFPGSGSTIKPKRKFDGVAVPSLAHGVQPSPLARVTKPARASHIIVKKPSSKASDVERSDHAELEVDELDNESVEGLLYNAKNAHAEERQRSPDIFDPLPKSKPRISAVSASSVLTVDTRSSKLDNTTTTNATTLTSRSVGPAPPPNAKQVPRISTSTGTGTLDITRSSFGSHGSHGAIDGIDLQPSQFSQNASGASSGPSFGGLVRSSSLREAHIDEDDREAEKILEQFDQFDIPEEEVHIQTLRSDDEDGGLEIVSREEARVEGVEREEMEEVGTVTALPLSPWEKEVIALCRELKRWNDAAGIQTINTLRENWPLRLRKFQGIERQDGDKDQSQEKAEPAVNEPLQAEKEHHRKQKGKRKGRVSFHKPPEDRNRDELLSNADAAENQEFEEHVKEQERSSSSLLRGLKPRRRTDSPASPRSPSPSPAPLPSPSPELFRVPISSYKSDEAEADSDVVDEPYSKQNEKIKQEWNDAEKGSEREEKGTEKKKRKEPTKGKAKSTSTPAATSRAEPRKPRAKAANSKPRKQQKEPQVKSKEFPSDEEVDELEDDELGPLPSLPVAPEPTKRSRAKRAASVVSEDGSVTGAASVFVPRRGRSASLPPVEPSPPVPASSRKPPKKTARKTTGQKEPRKR